MAHSASSLVASIPSSISSWVTPTSLLLFLYVVITTIFIISRNKRNPIQESPQYGSFNPQMPLVRNPSLLERVKSMNFSLHSFEPSYPETEHLQPVETHEPKPYPNPSGESEPLQTQLARAPSLLQRLKSIKVSSFYRTGSAVAEDVDGQGSGLGGDSGQGSDLGHLVKRSKSETIGDAPEKSSENLRKSSSEKGVSGYSEIANVEWRQPATVRSRRDRDTTSFVRDDGVDAKADDFINRFKQQLRLQRLDSLLRYKEMLKRN